MKIKQLNIKTKNSQESEYLLRFLFSLGYRMNNCKPLTKAIDDYSKKVRLFHTNGKIINITTMHKYYRLNTISFSEFINEYGQQKLFDC